MVISPEMLDEFRKTLTNGKFSINGKEIDDIVSMMSLLAMIISPQTKLNVVKDDPGDNKFPECVLDSVRVLLFPEITICLS